MDPLWHWAMLLLRIYFGEDKRGINRIEKERIEDPEETERREGWSGLSKGRWGREDERNGRRGKERYEQKTLEKEQEC